MPSPYDLTRRGALCAALLVFAAYLGVVAANHAAGDAAAARGEVPLYTDFTTLYAAALQLRAGAAADLYRAAPMYQAGQAAARAAYAAPLSDAQARGVGRAPFLYPPLFIPVAAPLAHLPYRAALAAWLALTGLVFAAALHAILRARSAWVFALAAPPVFFNLMYGQTGFLSAGLIGLGLALLGPRPLAAGVLIGLASVKPHLGVLLPLALALGGHWRAFAAAAASVLGLAAATLLAWGPEPWAGFLATAPQRFAGIAAGAYDFSAMSTVLGALMRAGASPATAWSAQALAAAAALAAVVWAWWPRRGAAPAVGLQSAVLCAATLLALPLGYLYDLTLLVPAAAWLWRDMAERGCRPWEPAVVGASLLGLLAAKHLAKLAAIQIGPLAVAAVLALALLRLHEARRPAGAG